MAGSQEISRRKPILKNRVDPAIEEAVTGMAIEQLAMANREYPTNSRNGAYRFLLGESQVRALEKAREEKWRWGD